MKRYCPKCGKAAEWKEGERPRDLRGPPPKIVEKGLICSRCGYLIKPKRLEKLIPVTPMAGEYFKGVDGVEVRHFYADCDHVFEDVTEERRSLLAESELPGWAKALIEKKDRKWVNRSERWRSLTYLKCSECGLLRIVDQIDGGK